jgi:hypothetical protein
MKGQGSRRRRGGIRADDREWSSGDSRPRCPGRRHRCRARDQASAIHASRTRGRRDGRQIRARRRRSGLMSNIVSPVVARIRDDRSRSAAISTVRCASGQHRPCVENELDGDDPRRSLTGVQRSAARLLVRDLSEAPSDLRMRTRRSASYRHPRGGCSAITSVGCQASRRALWPYPRSRCSRHRTRMPSAGDAP